MDDSGPDCRLQPQRYGDRQDLDHCQRYVRRYEPYAGLHPLRHVASTQWGNKKFMNMKHLEAAVEDASMAG